jgi:hypothetical protein
MRVTPATEGWGGVVKARNILFAVESMGKPDQPPALEVIVLARTDFGMLP